MSWPKGKPRSEETKRKISAWGQANNAFRGKHHTEENKKKASQRMTILLKGNKRRLGIPHTEETKRKISEASKANWQDGNFRKKVRKWWDSLTKEQKRDATMKSTNAMKAYWDNLSPKERVELTANGREACKQPRILKKRSIAISGGKNPMFGKHLSEERKRQIGDAGRGDKNPRWQGGISFLPYPYTFTKELKERIRERDGYRCRLCGVPQIECNQKLSIHHIDYIKENLDGDNLISLCRGCNSKVNNHRDHWQSYFTRLIAEG